MLLDTKNVITPAVLAIPEFIDDGGIRKKISGYVKTENGLDPVYEPTDEISQSDAFNIIFGGAE